MITKGGMLQYSQVYTQQYRYSSREHILYMYIRTVYTMDVASKGVTPHGATLVTGLLLSMQIRYIGKMMVG